MSGSYVIFYEAFPWANIVLLYALGLAAEFVVVTAYISSFANYTYPVIFDLVSALTVATAFGCAH